MGFQLNSSSGMDKYKELIQSKFDKFKKDPKVKSAYLNKINEYTYTIQFDYYSGKSQIATFHFEKLRNY